MTKQKKDFKLYQELMKQKFDLEDKIKVTGHDIWLKKNEKLKCHKQLGLVEDQVREFFQRKRIEFEDEDETNNITH